MPAFMFTCSILYVLCTLFVHVQLASPVPIIIILCTKYILYSVLCTLYDVATRTVPYSSKFSRSKTSVIQPAQLLTDNTFRDSLLLQ